jgi:hypothetical protein
MRLVRIIIAVVMLSGLLVAASPEITKAASDQVIADVVFKEVERRVIGDYFDRNYRRQSADDGHKTGKKKKDKDKHKSKGKSKGIPPGLQGRKDLPPGIRKQIARGQRVPDGVNIYRLPSDLVSRLPRRSKDVERRVVGDDIVLIERGTNLVLDILENVLRK